MYALSNSRGLPAGRQNGFSLLEILVAFAILSISLGVVFQIYSTGLTGALRSDLSSKAAILAASQLARVGTELEVAAASHSGESVEGYTWSMDISPYTLSEAESPGVEVFRVDVEIAKNDTEGFTYRVSTLKMAGR